MTDPRLQRAYDLFRQAASELEVPEALHPHELESRLRAVANRVLDTLDGGVPDDPMSRLDMQARDIADDLRRLEKLMKERLGGHDPIE